MLKALGLNGIRIKVGEEAAYDDPSQKGDEIGSQFALMIASEPLARDCCQYGQPFSPDELLDTHEQAQHTLSAVYPTKSRD